MTILSEFCALNEMIQCFGQFLNTVPELLSTVSSSLLITLDFRHFDICKCQSSFIFINFDICKCEPRFCVRLIRCRMIVSLVDFSLLCGVRGDGVCGDSNPFSMVCGLVWAEIC